MFYIYNLVKNAKEKNTEATILFHILFVLLNNDNNPAKVKKKNNDSL